MVEKGPLPPGVRSLTPGPCREAAPGCQQSHTGTPQGSPPGARRVPPSVWSAPERGVGRGDSGQGGAMSREIPQVVRAVVGLAATVLDDALHLPRALPSLDRKSTRLNSSHANISYAVFCLKKNNSTKQPLLCPHQQPALFASPH